MKTGANKGGRENMTDNLLYIAAPKDPGKPILRLEANGDIFERQTNRKR